MNIQPRPAIAESDRYVLQLAGRKVSRCYVETAFGMFFYHDGPLTEIRIEGKIHLNRKGEESIGDPVNPVSLGPLLILFGKSVVQAFAFKNGRLEIEFEQGLLLQVDPGEKYESWELVAKDGLKIVSLPGGSLDFWQSLPE